MTGYSVEAQPTRYKGVTFRSKLEARWAHLFDQIGMRWEYEPEPFRGWLPDFRIFGEVFVEVKPAHPVGFSMLYQHPEWFEKTLRWSHAAQRPVILLGDGPGSNFGALVSATGDDAGAKTIVYDPSERLLFRALDGDEGEDIGLFGLSAAWSKAGTAFAARTTPRAEQRRAMSLDADARRDLRSERGRRAMQTF